MATDISAADEQPPLSAPDRPATPVGHEYSARLWFIGVGTGASGGGWEAYLNFPRLIGGHPDGVYSRPIIYPARTKAWSEILGKQILPHD